MAASRRTQQQQQEGWHLDKRVPLALIVTLILQGAIGVMWATTLSHDVDQLKKEVSALATESRDQRSKLESFTKIEAQIDHMVTSLNRVQNKLDELFTRELEDARKTNGYRKKAN